MGTVALWQISSSNVSPSGDKAHNSLSMAESA